MASRRAPPLPRPIIEFYYKDDALGDPLVTEEHIIAFGWAGQQDLDDIVALALRVNDFLSGVMLAVGIKLVDFKIEIGRIWENDFQRLIVADEISPDSLPAVGYRKRAEAGQGRVPPRPWRPGRCLQGSGAAVGCAADERDPHDEAASDQLDFGDSAGFGRRPLPAAQGVQVSASSTRAQLRMPLWKLSMSYFSFGEWIWSSSRPKPISMESVSRIVLK